MIVHALGACHPDCPWCAREFWRWLRGTLKRDMYATGAAATSVRPPLPVATPQPTDRVAEPEPE